MVRRPTTSVPAKASLAAAHRAAWVRVDRKCRTARSVPAKASLVARSCPGPRVAVERSRVLSVAGEVSADSDRRRKPVALFFVL